MKTRKHIDRFVRTVALVFVLGPVSALESTAMDWHSGELVVPSGDTVLLTTPGSENCLDTGSEGTVVTVNGSMDVRFGESVVVSEANAWRVNIRNGSGALISTTPTISLGQEHGSTGTLTIDHAYLNTFVGSDAWGSVKFGTNGRLVLSNGAYVRIDEVRIPSDSVPGASGQFEGVEIGQGSVLRLNKLRNDTQYPFVIKFMGADSFLLENYISNMMFWCPYKDNFILRGVNNTPITILSEGSQLVLFSNNSWFGGGTIRTEGECDVRFYSTFADANNECIFELAKAGINWQNSGDLCVCVKETQTWRRNALRVTATDALPYGSQTGMVRIENGTSCRLEVNASQKLNGLYLSEGSTIKNATSMPVVLTFGTGDTDGLLSANTSFSTDGAINLAKTGMGTLIVTNTPAIPSLDVTGGVVRFKETDCTVSVLTIASGAKIIADGCTVTCPLVKSATFEEVNGGHVAVVVNTSGTMVDDWSDTVPAISVLEKTGSGSYTYMSESAFIGDVYVKDGRLVFTAVGTTNEWLKFVFKDMWNNNPFELSEIKLVDVTGNIMAGAAYQNAASDCAAKDMTRQSIWASDQTWLYDVDDGYAKMKPSALLDGAAYTRLIYGTGNTARLNDPSTWKTFIIRLPSSVNALSGFNLMNGYSSSRGGPEHWELWTSADGEMWEKSDDYACASPRADNKLLWKTDGHFAIKTVAGIPGGGGIASTANVRVDSGAVLDCSSVTGGQVISRLTCDMVAGGGTLRNVKFAASGVLTLVGVTKSQLKGGVVVPLTFEGITGVENLADWQVVVGGAVSSKSLAWSNGMLTLVAPGFSIVVR